ncbi:MAG: FHA domain-containing protein [Planctomycetes bacterium]|nr:FHA domain-containing protein [Planctomycetota bacterium]
MAKLIVIQGGREKSFDLIDDFVFVGSGADCAIRVAGSGVAERHCQILKVEGSYRLIDLGGGTKVGGRPVQQHELASGDVIQVGDASLTFRGGLKPAAEAPRAAAAPAPVRPGGPAARAGAARPGRTARRGARRGGGGREVVVTQEMQKAAGQREILKRQNVRKPGLSGPVMLGIAGLVVLVVAIIGYKIMTGVPSGDWGRIYAQALDAFQHSKHEEAIKLLESIPEGAPNYRVAQNKLAEIKAGVTTAVDLELHQHGETDYQNNILGFVQSKIDNPKYEGETAYVRILVRRLENFLVEFKGHKREAEVKRLLGIYKERVPATPPNAHETWIDADVERAREMYGRAYTIVSSFLAKNPGVNAEEKKALAELQGKIVRCAKEFWQWQNEAAEKNVQTDHYDDAYSKYLTAMRRLEGLPEMYDVAKKKADFLKTQAADKIVRKPK